MKKSILILITIITLTSCTDNKEAKRILEAEGYTDIRFTGYQCFSCGKDDWYSTGFVAKTIKGIEVKGVVCSGLLKGHTIRID